MGKTKTAFVSEGLDKNEKKHEKAQKASEGKVHISGLKGGQRVKMVEAESPQIEKTETKQDTDKAAGSKRVASKAEPRVERIRSQKYKDVKAKIDSVKKFPIKEAIKLVKETSYSKFDGTMELHLVVKKVGSNAQVTLPHAAGREKKVEIATDETIEKLRKGVIDYDILVASTEIMPKLVPFARVLGPKGLMPNPKNGTLVSDPKKAKSFSTGVVSLKTEKEAPLVHTVIGKNSQKDEEIAANTEAVLKAFGGGKQILKAYIKSTMSPSVKLQLN